MLIARTKIAHTEIRIFEVEDVEVDGEECYGSCVAQDDGHIRIEIQRGLTYEKFIEIFYHELSHAVEVVFHLDLPERVVHAIGVGLADAMLQTRWRRRPKAE